MRAKLGLGIILLVSPFIYGQDLLRFNDVKKLPEEINTNYADEIQPVFSTDSSNLYFVRYMEPENIGGTYDQDIWESSHDENWVWEKAFNVETLNNKENNGVFGLSEDGQTIYLLDAYLKKKKATEKGVALANKKGDHWEHHPQTLPIDNFHLSGSHYGFHINDAEDHIIISDSGKNTLGAEDLYVTIKDENGNWHEPIHLGPVVNSSGYEISPFLSKNADTLYFSSDRAGGYGMADIYFTVRLDDSWTNWSQPINLGSGINTDGFDAYFIKSENDVYWSSDRDSTLDLFHAKVTYPLMQPDEFFVTSSNDWSTHESNDGKIFIEGLRKEYTYDYLQFKLNGQLKKIDNVTTDSDGKLVLENMNTGEYTEFVAVVGKQEIPSADDANINKPAPPVVAQPKSDLLEEIVYFDLNSSYLQKDGKKTLNHLVKELKSKEQYEIVIIAHTDKRASNNYNEWLSERRMNRVKDYLISKGISASVISGEYKGEEDPVYNCEECDEEKHQENRRATIQVKF